MKYRADIDGLRALAVLPIVLFHARVPGLPGGYVGVDIFFVISGYLITKIIFSEIQERKFSVIEFYDRRIRRIFPAFFAMMIFVSVVSYFVLVPYDLRMLGKSILGAMFFASNIVFYSEAGYFSSSSDLKPLLHTWSLGVEEQFYVFFPILICLSMKVGRVASKALLWAVFVASFIACLVLTAKLPAFAFFMLPTRAWELLAGGLLAVGAIPIVSNAKISNAVAVVGLMLIASAVVFFSARTPFPGVAATLPVLGAGMLIYSGPKTFVAQVLGAWPFRFVGKISYSFYLWHWPVIVFYEYWALHEMSGWASVGAIVVSLAMAYLSWRFIETPFRQRAQR